MLKLDPILLKKSAIFGLVSAELVAYIGGGIAIGWLLDSWLNTSPIAKIIGAMLGLGLAVFRILRFLTKSMDEKK